MDSELVEFFHIIVYEGLEEIDILVLESVFLTL